MSSALLLTVPAAGFILTSPTAPPNTQGCLETPTWEGLAELRACPASPGGLLERTKFCTLLAKPDTHEQVKVQPPPDPEKGRQDARPDAEAELRPQ